MNFSQVEELEVLKKRCLQGDELAWQELMRMVLPYVQNIGRFHFNLNEQIARDLAQDTVIKMTQGLESIINIRSWVGRVMRNKCIDYLRKKKEYLSDEERDIPDFSNRPGAAIEQFEMASVLKEALGNLPERCRELLKMRFLEDKDHKEISQELGLPYAQVPVNQARCLKKMKLLLEKEHPQIWEWLETL